MEKKYDFISQKLIDLVNNSNSRQALIAYIKKIDNNNPVIKLLLSDYKLEYNKNNNIKELKENPNNVYYWVTKWKDEYHKKIQKIKPIFTENINFKSIPINLIINSSDMIPYWIKYNRNINLYIIYIKINKLNKVLSKENNNLVSYYDINKQLWTSCKRILTSSGPACITLN